MAEQGLAARLVLAQEGDAALSERETRIKARVRVSSPAGPHLRLNLLPLGTQTEIHTRLRSQFTGLHRCAAPHREGTCAYLIEGLRADTAVVNGSSDPGRVTTWIHSHPSEQASSSSTLLCELCVRVSLWCTSGCGSTPFNPLIVKILSLHDRRHPCLIIQLCHLRKRRWAAGCRP